MYKKEDYADFTIFQLLQNIWEYTYSLKNNQRAKYWFWIRQYKTWCEEHLENKWKPCLLVLEIIDEINVLYCPGACGDTEKYAELLVKVKDAMKRIQLRFCRWSRCRFRRFLSFGCSVLEFENIIF